MSTTLIEVENRPIAKIEIDGATVLINGVTAQLNNALDQAEDSGPATVLFVHVVGHISHANRCIWPGQTDTQSVSKWERALRRIERNALPTVSLVEHSCSAVALELSLVTDRRLASSDFFMQAAIPGGNVWPGMALYRMSRQIGEARARKLFLDGGDFTAALAIEMNIVDEIVNDSVAASDRIAHLLREAPLEDFAVRRRLMQDSLSTSFDDALGAHLAACDRALRRSPALNRELSAVEDVASARQSVIAKSWGQQCP
jgi:isomerase DpgB